MEWDRCKPFCPMMLNQLHTHFTRQYTNISYACDFAISGLIIILALQLREETYVLDNKVPSVYDNAISRMVC